jgi:hypothetical protein
MDQYRKELIIRTDLSQAVYANHSMHNFTPKMFSNK